MATETVFATKYAHAFASVASAGGLDVAAAQRQMKDFAETLEGSRDLREVLMNPSIPPDQKLSVLDALAERIGMFREVRNFFAVMMDHDRLGQCAEIVSEYGRVADVDEGLVEALVTSARPLNEEDRTSLEQEIGRLAGSRVRVAYELNPSLLGGAVIKIGSKVYDGSLQAQFEQMRQMLISA